MKIFIKVAIYKNKQVFSFSVKNNEQNSRQILEVTLWYSNFHRRSKTGCYKNIKIIFTVHLLWDKWGQKNICQVWTENLQVTFTDYMKILPLGFLRCFSIWGMLAHFTFELLIPTEFKQDQWCTLFEQKAFFLSLLIKITPLSDQILTIRSSWLITNTKYPHKSSWSNDSQLHKKKRK